MISHKNQSSETTSKGHFELGHTIRKVMLLLIYASLTIFPGRILSSEKNTIHRAVLNNDLLWIIKHPIGAEVFDKNGPVTFPSNKIQLPEILDVSPHFLNSDSTLLASRKKDELAILSLQKNYSVEQMFSISLNPEEIFIRLFISDGKAFMLTDKRIVNLAEQGKSKILAFDEAGSDQPEENLFNRTYLVGNHICMRDSLILGFGSGEFGGGYLTVNLKSGSYTYKNLRASVTDLIKNRTNKHTFFISEGSTHLMSSSGSIFEIHGGGYEELYFLGNNYLFKILGLKGDTSGWIRDEGIPITGMFFNKADFYAVTEQNYILNLTSPEKEAPKQIGYEKLGNYRVHWISKDCVIVNLEHFLPFILARGHTRSSEYAASDENSIESTINQTIMVARQE